MARYLATEVMTGVILSVALFHCIVEAVVNKPYTLRMLALIPMTGSEPRDGKTCLAGAQVAVDAVNNRSDILKKYTILVDYRDEGAASNYAVKQYVDFIRNYKPGERNGTQFISPAMIGNDKNCQNNARIVAANYMVQFATSCLGPLVTGDRINFPNLYKNHIPTDSFLIPQLLFTIQVGKWKQIAILSNAGNSNDYIRSKFLYVKAVSLGLDVIWFGSVVDMDNTVALDLKSSNSRVIIVQFSDIPKCVQFFCFAYMNGIKGWPYVFLLAATSYFDPKGDVKLPTGCTRKMLIEQFDITFWVGPIDWAIANNGMTELGYDLDGFEALLDKATNKSRTPDYERRHRCHDTMEMALLAMDKADRILAAKHSNRSLKDFETEPQLVMKVVNQSAAESNFTGLRIGRISFSDRLEVDDELQYVSQFINGQLKLLYVAKFHGNNASVLYDLNAYEFVKIGEPLWLTRSKKPPPDLSNVFHDFNDLDWTYSYAIISLVCLFSLIHFGYLFALIFFRKVVWGFFTQKRSNLILLTGCFYCAIISIPFSLNPTISPSVLCFMKIAAPFVGFSLIVGILFARIVFLARRINLIARSRRSAQTRNARFFNFNRQRRTIVEPVFRLPPIDDKQRDKYISLIAVNLCLINIVIVTIILAVENYAKLKVSDVLISQITPVTFDPEVDAYKDTHTEACKLETNVKLIGTLIPLNFLPVIIGTFLAYEIRSAKIDDELRYELLVTRFCIVNVFTLFGVIVALEFFVPSTNVMLRSIILSVGSLILSNSTSSLTFLRAILNKQVRTAPPSDDPRPSTVMYSLSNTQQPNYRQFARCSTEIRPSAEIKRQSGAEPPTTQQFLMVPPRYSKT